MKNNTPLERITIGSIWQYLMDIASFERGMFYTIWQLAIRPGKAIRTFLLEDRTRLVKPVRCLIYLVAIGSLLSYYFIPFEGGLDRELLETIAYLEERSNVDVEKFKKAMINMTAFTHNYINLIMLINIPILSIFSYSIYKKLTYNFAEHLVINTFLIAFMNVIIIAFTLLQIANPDWTNILATIRQPLIILYFIFAYFTFFKIPSVEGIVRAICSIFCSCILFAPLINTILIYFFYQNS